MARKATKSSSRNYFTKETEEWIIKYNACTDQKEKDRIFTDHIYFPFYKLAENIINTFKFYHTDVNSIEDLKLDIIEMLVTDKIQRFDPSKGAKAFSYFGTIVKRWLIAYSNKNYDKQKLNISISSCEDWFSEDQKSVQDKNTITLSQFIDLWVERVYSNLDKIFNKPSEKQIADAVLTVFRTRKNLEDLQSTKNFDMFRKKAFYLYIREITGCDTPFLTKVILKLKDNFYKMYAEYIKQDLIETEVTDY